VLRQALILADNEGIDALSMRRLGRALDAGAMSLYHHVGNKEELLDGMVDLVFAEIHLPESGGDWQAAMRARAVSAREVLVRHPWAITLMESRTTPGPANLRHREAVTACQRPARSASWRAARSRSPCSAGARRRRHWSCSSCSSSS
jgi:AcrR family transcriptional regulator